MPLRLDLWRHISFVNYTSASLTVSHHVTYALNIFSHPTTQVVVPNDIFRQITAWLIIFAPFNQHPSTMK
ncbi:hypothetical protein [Proteus terrae]|uniref:hypothetical protein n=1 Tax=Proteus terrae TaxID=1574161 RepID=UPI00287181BD|nr:hypothetical protein [Proteus terrae]MDR9741524.1 hypothetical protein [Proteus terrae]